MELAAIVYTSATGFTRQYAGLLSAACGLPAMALKGAVPPPGPVLYLGWLRAGSVQGLRSARRRFPVAGVCAVGMAPPEQADLERLRRANRAEGLPLFYLRGGYAPGRLGWADRLAMAAMEKWLAWQPGGIDPEMEAVFARGADWVSSAQLAPVLSWLERGWTHAP